MARIFTTGSTRGIGAEATITGATSSVVKNVHPTPSRSTRPRGRRSLTSLSGFQESVCRHGAFSPGRDDDAPPNRTLETVRRGIAPWPTTGEVYQVGEVLLFGSCATLVVHVERHRKEQHEALDHLLLWKP